MQENSSKLGATNRTGLQMSPMHSRELMEVVTDTVAPDPSDGEQQAMAQMRGTYIAESEGLGTVPAPLTLKGMVKTGAQLLTGNRPQVLMDKLAERAAFERGGTRLYDGLIGKALALQGTIQSPSPGELMEIRADEARHFELVSSCIESLGGDPTAQTPAADLVGIEAMGWMQTINDPRTTFAQSLHAILAAELVDVAGWDMLANLAEGAGLKDMADSFRLAHLQEESHLARVRSWYEALTMAEMKG
jgi:ferritin-like protein